VPTDEQLLFGHQQGVKLRLGRLTTGGQKGVDSRIVRDLIVLSRNRAVSTAYLVSGDEDVREGVVEAQEFGVSVVLVGIEPPPTEQNQAPTLVREADDLIVLSRSECSKFISRSTEAKARRPQAAIEVEVGADASPTEFGEVYGAAARKNLDPETVSSILSGHPRIPSTIDVRLIKEATVLFGDPMEQSVKHEIRAGFWVGIQASSEDGNPSDGDAEPEPEEAPAAG